MGTCARAGLTLPAQRLIPKNAAVGATEGANRAGLDAQAAVVAHNKGLWIVTEEAAQIAALQEDDSAIPRSIHETVSENLVDDSQSGRLTRCAGGAAICRLG